MAKHGLRMAKADKKDIESTQMFLHALETINDSHFKIEDWDDGENRGNGFYDLLKSMLDEDGEPDTESILFAFNRSCACRWRRVVLGADILIDSVCDPDKDYLDYKPELKNAVPRDTAKKLLKWTKERYTN
jgi:hypothetical protein